MSNIYSEMLTQMEQSGEKSSEFIEAVRVGIKQERSQLNACYSCGYLADSIDGKRAAKKIAKLEARLESLMSLLQS